MEFGEPPPKHNDLPSMHDLVIRDMDARKRFGLEKYGTLLQPFNGRNALKDAYEEVLDLAVYLRQALWERDNPAAKPNEGEPAQPAATWCHCNDSREGHEYGTGMHCARHVAAASTPPDKRYPQEVREALPAEKAEGPWPARLHVPTAEADVSAKDVAVDVNNPGRCYCGGPEEVVYGHVYGKGRFCGERVDGGK